MKRKRDCDNNGNDLAEAANEQFIFKTEGENRVLTVGMPGASTSDMADASEKEMLTVMNSLFGFPASRVATTTVYVLNNTGCRIDVIAARRSDLEPADVSDLARLKSACFTTMTKFHVRFNNSNADRIHLQKKGRHEPWLVGSRNTLRVHLHNTHRITISPGNGRPIVHGEHPLIDFVSSRVTSEVSLPAKYSISDLPDESARLRGPRLWHVVHIGSGSAAVFLDDDGDRGLIECLELEPWSFRITHQQVETSNHTAFSGWHSPKLTTASLSEAVTTSTGAPSPVVGIILSFTGTLVVDIGHFLPFLSGDRYVTLSHALGRPASPVRCGTGAVLQVMKMGRLLTSCDAIDIDTPEAVIRVTNTTYTLRLVLMAMARGLLPSDPLEVYRRRGAVARCVFRIDGDEEVSADFALGFVAQSIRECAVNSAR